MTLASAEQSIFAKALECPTPASCEAWLAEACADDAQMRRRVEALLAAAENAGDFLDLPAAGEGGAMLPADEPGEKPGDRIGRYKILEQIGESSKRPFAGCSGFATKAPRAPNVTTTVCGPLSSNSFAASSEGSTPVAAVKPNWLNDAISTSAKIWVIRVRFAPTVGSTSIITNPIRLMAI